MRKNQLQWTLAFGALAGYAASADAAVINSFTTVDATIAPVDDGYDPAAVSAFVASNVTGPSSGADLTAGNVGLVRLWNSEWAGFSLSAGNGAAIDNATEFGTGYLTWTVTADPGYLLQLTSLDFNSARGGTTATRGYEIYATTNGAPFTFGDVPVIDVDNATGTRGTPVPTSVDLSGAAFQNIQSVSFRYYALTEASSNTIDFSGMTLQGAVVVPEPAVGGVVAAVFLGSLALRRRRW